MSRVSEAGDTLIEVLIALIVLSLGGLALLVTFGTAIAASAEHRSLATNETVLQSSAEVAFSLIQQQLNPLYTTCATPSDYASSDNFGAPTGYRAVITSIEYWVQSASPPQFETSCPAGSTAPQLVTISVSAPNGTTVQSQFVVDARGDYAPAGDQVNSVLPSTLSAGAAAQTLSISGSGFVNGDEVSFSGSGINVSSTTFVNSTTLDAVVSVSSAATPGNYTISVTTPSLTTFSSAPIFSVNAPISVTGISPSSAAPGTSGQSVTITGSGFLSGAVPNFQSTSGITISSFQVVNSTSITAIISVSSTASAGSSAVSVTNPDGTSSTSSNVFTVT